MIATIAKRFTFDAAHHLPTVPEDHKCHRMHGHTYTVELVLIGEVQPNGFVVDYADIEALWRPLHDALDHRVLNEVPGLAVPSTEYLCFWIIHRVSVDLRNEVMRARQCLRTVRIYESSTTWCEMEVGDPWARLSRVDAMDATDRSVGSVGVE